MISFSLHLNYRIGEILSAKISCPGIWHDSRAASRIYEQLELDTPMGFSRVVADSAFPTGGRPYFEENPRCYTTWTASSTRRRGTNCCPCLFSRHPFMSANSGVGYEGDPREFWTPPSPTRHQRHTTQAPSPRDLFPTLRRQGTVNGRRSHPKRLLRVYHHRRATVGGHGTYIIPATIR